MKAEDLSCWVIVMQPAKQSTVGSIGKMNNEEMH